MKLVQRGSCPSLPDFWQRHRQQRETLLHSCNERMHQRYALLDKAWSFAFGPSHWNLQRLARTKAAFKRLLQDMGSCDTVVCAPLSNKMHETSKEGTWAVSNDGILIL